MKMSLKKIMNKEKQNLKSIFLLTKCFSVRMEEYTYTTLTLTTCFGLRFTTPRQVSVWQKEYIPTLTLTAHFGLRFTTPRQVSVWYGSTPTLPPALSRASKEEI